VSGETIAEADAGDLEAACGVAALTLDLDPDDAARLPRFLWAEDPGTVRVRLLARSGSDVVGVLIGSLQGDEAFLDLIAVAPQARNQGIARRLLHDWEGRAAAAGAVRLKVGENLRSYVWPGVDVRYTPGLCLLIRAGYTRTQVVYNMDLPLQGFHGPDRHRLDRLTAIGIQARRGEPDDRQALTAHVRRHWSTTWLREATLALEKPRPTIFLALRDEAVVGFAAHGVYRPALYGPIATDPAEQGHGVGDVLSRLCLADMAANGVGTAQIGWVAEAAIPFYSRTVGARLGRCFWMLAKPVPTAPAPGPGG
jgi:ribosomal protein S18 acetylase RimI-like enzyme